MKRYARVTGIFFSMMTVLQLTRTIRGWPIQVAGVDIPIWMSLVAVVVTGGFAAWGFRTARAAT